MNDPAIDVVRLRRRLAAREDSSSAVGRRIEYHNSLPSTNDRARELALSGEPEGTVVIAGEQTLGRGRDGRAWHSPPGLGLYLSVILRPQADPRDAPLFGLMAAVAAASALTRLASRPVGIEWPNDLVAAPAQAGGARRKVGGILSEARVAQDSLRDIVVGIGVNVAHEAADFPRSLAGRAASLAMLAGSALETERAAEELLSALSGWYNLWERDGDAPVVAAYRDRALDLDGRRVRVTGGGPAWCGRTAGITGDGALRVRPDSTGEDDTPGVVEIRYGDVLRIEEV